MSPPTNVLLVEDSPDDAFFIERELHNSGMGVELIRIEGPEQLRRALHAEVSFDIVLTDYNLTTWTGLDVLEQVLFHDPLLPVVLVSGRVGEERAVEVIRRGARDYVSKDALLRLPEVVAREIKNAAVERRELEMAERLQQSEARFGQVFRRSPDPMFITGASGTVIRDANEAFARLSGQQPHELIGMDIRWAVPWRNPGSVEEAVQLMASGRTLESRELVLERNGSTQHHILWTAEGQRGSDGFGEEGGVLWLGKDITRTLQMEKNLRDTERLRSLGTLSGGIAHDFNNILMVMMGYTEMALGKSEDPRITRYLGEVHHAVQRARELIRQILAFSSGDEGERSEIKPAPVVKEVLKLLRPSIPSFIKIEKNISSGRHILGDPSHIHQMVMNLCTNSYQAMRNTGGKLSVELHDVTLDGEEYVELVVADTGAGMSRQTRNRIFEPFFTTREVGEGTGLGLSVVHGLVESYGGHIEVESTEGEGTRFLIRLPTAGKAGRRLRPKEKTVEMLRGGGRLLIVDDEEKVAGIISLMAEELGYSPVVSYSPEDALREIIRAAEEGNPFDGVLTDLTMPGMSGQQLAEQIKTLLPDLPVLLCSGYYEIDRTEEGNTVVDDFLTKPIEKHALARKLYTHITLPKEGRNG
jgi:PAS domain S-box-containing protein